MTSMSNRNEPDMGPQDCNTNTTTLSETVSTSNPTGSDLIRIQSLNGGNFGNGTNETATYNKMGQSAITARSKQTIR